MWVSRVVFLWVWKEYYESRALWHCPQFSRLATRAVISGEYILIRCVGILLAGSWMRSGSHDQCSWDVRHQAANWAAEDSIEMAGIELSSLELKDATAHVFRARNILTAKVSVALNNLSGRALKKLSAQVVDSSHRLHVLWCLVMRYSATTLTDLEMLWIVLLPLKIFTLFGRESNYLYNLKRMIIVGNNIHRD